MNAKSYKKKYLKLLIIDPCVVTPEVNTYNNLASKIADFSDYNECKFNGIQILLPQMTKVRLADLATKNDFGAVISLGSYANMTDSHPWAQHLAVDILDHIIKPRIPLLAICFSHQLLAHKSGACVNFLKKKAYVIHGKHHEFRKSQIRHPYLRLLLSKFKREDYFSNNLLDLNFREVVLTTRDWNAEKWRNIFFQRDWVLTAAERRVKNFIENCTGQKYITHARHEQEVHNLPPKDWCLAASSPQCTFDALVHTDAPAFTFQTHPETLHPERDGDKILQNFLYFSQSLACGAT